MDITEYIDTNLFITVPVLYVLGMMIKKSPLSDRFIPLILGAVGILLALTYKLSGDVQNGIGGIASTVFSGITQGILCAACSVYANNIFKQLKKGDKDDSFKDSEKGD